MRVYTQSEKDLRKTERISQSIPAPDRITPSGKRIWYTGRDLDAEAGIYFVGAMGADLIKIGWVRHMAKLEARLDRLRIDCPYPVIPLFTFGPATRIHEGRAQKHFIDQHFHGEWFRYGGALREFLELAGKDEWAACEALGKIVDVRFTG